jgi:hypothetical protein
VSAGRRANLLGRDYSLALQDGVELVGVLVLDDIGCAGWPSDLIQAGRIRDEPNGGIGGCSRLAMSGRADGKDE